MTRMYFTLAVSAATREACAALTGTVGQQVACGIYEWRPSPCREFEEGSHACNRYET